MVIPFVVHFERLDATCNGVFRQRFIICVPVGVDAPVHFKIAADPIEESVAARPFLDFHAVMNAAHSGPARGGSVHFCEVGIHHVSAAAVAIHDDGVSILKLRRIRRPAVAVNSGVEFVTRRGVQ